jgi:hypothetical protein
MTFDYHLSKPEPKLFHVRLSVGQSVLVSGICEQFFFFVGILLNSYGLLLWASFVTSGRICILQLLLGLTNAFPVWFVFRGTRLKFHIPPVWKVRFSHLSPIREQGNPVYNQSVYIFLMALAIKPRHEPHRKRLF